MVFVYFFFQAEDGIRDIGVTGVQTCALPILRGPRCSWPAGGATRWSGSPRRAAPRAAVPRSRRATRSTRRAIGRAAGWGRGEISGAARSLKKKMFTLDSRPLSQTYEHPCMRL